MSFRLFLVQGDTAKVLLKFYLNFYSKNKTQNDI